MPRYTIDGMIRWHHVPTIANIAAPTVAEINAGTDLTPHTNKDGLTVPANQNYADDAALSDTFDAQRIGSEGGPISATLKRNNTTDTAWDLIVRGLTGYAVVRRGVAHATAFAAGQDVEVYPIEWHDPLPAQTATNTQDSFTANAAVTAQPNRKAVVAA